MTKYNCYAKSRNEEIWNADTPDEAISEVLEDLHETIMDGDIIFIGCGIKGNIQGSNYAPDLADFLTERADEECPEDVSHNWLTDRDTNEELQAEFEHWLNGWLDKRGLQPTFWTVTNHSHAAYRITWTDESDVRYKEEKHPNLLYIISLIGHDNALKMSVHPCWEQVAGDFDIPHLEQLASQLNDSEQDELVCGPKDRQLRAISRHKLNPLTDFMNAAFVGDLRTLFFK